MPVDFILFHELISFCGGLPRGDGHYSLHVTSHRLIALPYAATLSACSLMAAHSLVTYVFLFFPILVLIHFPTTSLVDAADCLVTLVSN
jgi:hypothetical protein